MKKILIALLLVGALTVDSMAYPFEGYIRKAGQIVTGLVVATLTPDQAVRMSDAHGRYQDAVAQGNVYTLNCKAVTVAATVNVEPLPALGAPLCGISNPIGSGKNAVILQITNSLVSGTPGGPLTWDCWPTPNSNAIVASSTVYNAFTLANTGSSMRGLYNASLPSIVGAAVPIRTISGAGAGAAAGSLGGVSEPLDGLLTVPPGAVCGLAAQATGTSHIVSMSIEWEEVPQ